MNNTAQIQFSFIIPVYNRPKEIEELLDSMLKQSELPYEIVIVEDGSTETSEEVITRYQNQLNICYYQKTNTGPGDSRNYGMRKAQGNYFIVLDSDVILPANYIQSVRVFLEKKYVHCFGGPDRAHPSFTSIQKAINYSMTSFFTTGGIRGGKKQLDDYQPRSFNMGMSKTVFEKTGGYSNLKAGEDLDLSFRISKAGFKRQLIHDAYVYHKRRINFQKFRKQVHAFGIGRVLVTNRYPETFKFVYALPTVFLLGSIGALIFTIFIHPFFIFPNLLHIILLFIDASLKTKSVEIGLLAIFASYNQLFNYGWGFFKAFIRLRIFKIPEKKAFPGFFYKKAVDVHYLDR